jgi:hypothetical protein
VGCGLLAALAVDVFVVPVTDVSIGVLVLLHPVKFADENERTARKQSTEHVRKLCGGFMVVGVIIVRKHGGFCTVCHRKIYSFL